MQATDTLADTLNNTLTDTERATLDLERGWYMHSGIKETRVREEFGVSLTTYYRRLHVLIDDPRALAYDAQLVNRLRRLRDSRRAVRTGSRPEHPSR